MIVQETRIKSTSGHQAVSRHVLSGAKNEAIRLISGSDYLLKDWMKEAKREGIRYGLRHIAFNPSEPMTDQQLSDFAEDICRELGADPERITFVIHQKDGKIHGHLLLPEWQDSHVLSSKFSWARLEKLARLAEVKLGHALVPGRHDKAIVKALKEAGENEAASKVEALIPMEKTPPPVAAYTSQARRMTERQNFDLPIARREIMTFWEKSENDLRKFRHFLSSKNWSMRAGDRTDRRRDAHIIETEDGLLIGSFTRLTKVRMKDFRQLLEDEASQKPLLDLRPIAKKSEAREARHASLEQREHTDEMKAERLRLQKRLPVIVPFKNPERLSAGFQIYLKDWKTEMQAARAVLNAKHPLEKKYGPEIPLDIQSQRIMDLIKQGRARLKKAHEAVQRARVDLEELEAGRWVLFKGQKVSKAEEALQQALAQLGEILRYIVQAVLYYLGLSGTKPAPLQLPVPIERQMSRQEYVESRQKLLGILLNDKSCRAWVKGHCRDAEHKRARLIEQWHEERAPEVEKAEQAVVQLQTLARPPRRIPEEVRARIVTLKRCGDFHGALNEVRLLDAVPPSQSVGQPVNRMPLQLLERGRRGHQEQKMSLQ
ncbi:relaxase/mobilization nuclease domain-containing protein [Gluconobacter sp. OJB]|uniref:relaxase/mobilization nuclease domain-containing protein n=1 Tax=Gluconobacter sp. OJB TaxID=3145196 RepID=UPI0031F95457